VTELERRMYVALLGARTIVAATANVNPKAFRIKALIDQVCAAYKTQKDRETPALDQLEETDDAARESAE
jgi:hypothetical protein